MTEIYPIIEDAITQIQDEIATIEPVRADAVGLDARAGYLYPMEDGILIPQSYQRTLNYYGGFEYIEPCHVYHLGEYIFYSNEAERVYNALSNLEE